MGCDTQQTVEGVHKVESSYDFAPAMCCSSSYPSGHLRACQHMAQAHPCHLRAVHVRCPRMQSYLSMSETETAVTSTFAPYRQHEVAIPLSRAATCLEEVGREVYGPAKLWEGERMHSRDAGIQCGEHVPALQPQQLPARQPPAHALMRPSPILLPCRRPHPLPAALHHRRGLVPVPRTRRACHVHQLRGGLQQALRGTARSERLHLPHGWSARGSNAACPRGVPCLQAQHQGLGFAHRPAIMVIMLCPAPCPALSHRIMCLSAPASPASSLSRLRACSASAAARAGTGGESAGCWVSARRAGLLADVTSSRGIAGPESRRRHRLPAPLLAVLPPWPGPPSHVTAAARRAGPGTPSALMAPRSTPSGATLAARCRWVKCGAVEALHGA